MSLRQRRSSLPATFREAFEGKQDQSVKKIDTADYSGLLVKLKAKGIITDRHKRQLQTKSLVEKSNTEDYSGRLVKLQSKGVTTRCYKRWGC